MLNATIKPFLLLLLIATLGGLTGCSSPEEKRAKQIQSALELYREGSHTEALGILEDLAILFPNDSEILYTMGRIYATEGDFSMAAFFLEQAHLQEPDNVELLDQTYQALFTAGQPSGNTLEKLLALSPDRMTNERWVRLGEYRVANNQTEAALEAYLKGVNPDEAEPSPETAAAIGQLFAKLDNAPQAADWFEIAAGSNDPSALTALFGLLEIQLGQQSWTEAERTIARLEKQFPGAIDASEWKEASEELKEWRKAQEVMKAKLAAAEAAKKAEEKAAQATVEAPTEATEVLDEAVEGKSQVIADLEAAEALANQPAEETSVSMELADAAAIEEAADKTKAITFDPSIAVEPAEPNQSFSVSYDEEARSPETSYAVEASATEDTTSPVQPVLPTKTVDELLADAETAEIDRDFKGAIRKYWSALGIEDERADVWNLLSRAYLVDSQLKNAETAALESVRLAPNEVSYTLDYLRVAQRSLEPKDFLAQLETAYDRFPSSPEITLSLARAHERISKDNFVARNLYLRFIDIAPNHPLVPEARDAVARL
ncbi:MAG: tetratricopeptide repeat protein [Verrucomicrobiota bacterium]